MRIPQAHFLSKKRVGAHCSISGGVQNALKEAKSIGGTALALFVRSSRQWKAKPLAEKDIKAFRAGLRQSSNSTTEVDNFLFAPEHILPHGSYLANLANPTEEARAKSLALFIDELQKCEQLGIQKHNIHPGSTKKLISVDEGTTLIAQAIDLAHKETDKVMVVLENTAGGGASIGRNFQEIADIIAKVEKKDRVGVCLDTCHLFAAGYDIRTREGYDSTMDEFGKVIGWKYLQGMHLNDSKADLGSNVDRHECIGEGKIGIDTFRFVMNDSRLDNIPMLIETPATGDDRAQIALLYSLEDAPK